MSTYYAVIGGPKPGIVNTWAEARLRTHKKRGTYSRRFDDLGAARAYYEEVTGTPAPPVHDPQGAMPRPQQEPQEDALISVKNPNGTLERRNPTQEQIDGLRGLGLWP